MKIQIFDSLNDKLLRDWQMAWKNSSQASIYNSPTWFQACLKSFNYSNYKIFTVYDGSKIMAILPMVYERKYSVNALVCPGGKYTDKSSLLEVKNDSKIRALLIAAIQEFKNIYIQEFQTDQALELSGSFGWRFCAQPLSINYYLPLDQNATRFITKKNLKRLESLLKNNRAHLTFNLLTKPTLADFDVLKRLEYVSNRSDRNLMQFNDKSAVLLYKTLIAEYPGTVNMAVLKYDGQLIAGDIGFVDHDTYTGVFTVYNRAYMKIGPGKLCKYLLLQSLVKNGFKMLDMSRGEASYKREMSPLCRHHADVYWSSNLGVVWWWHTINKMKTFLESRPKIYEVVRSLKHAMIKNVRYATCF